MIFEEIKKKIDTNNIEIEKLLVVDSFVLNKKVQKLVKENSNLIEQYNLLKDDKKTEEK